MLSGPTTPPPWPSGGRTAGNLASQHKMLGYMTGTKSDPVTTEEGVGFLIAEEDHLNHQMDSARVLQERPGHLQPGGLGTEWQDL